MVGSPMRLARIPPTKAATRAIVMLIKSGSSCMLFNLPTSK
jgi:hypothetical protein